MELKMLNKLLVGAAAIAIFGGVAFAENNAANPPPQGQAQDQSAQNNPDQNQDGQGWWGGMWRHRHGGHGMHGMMDSQGGQDGPGFGGPGGPGGPGMMAMMNHQGFKLHLGNGIDVGVMCGKEALKDCIAEAQPLIDAAKAAATAQPTAKTP
jgi:hypothetical protein